MPDPLGGTDRRRGTRNPGSMSDTTLEIVLVDWNMPGISGLDLVCAVRANPHYQTLPLMMATAETERSQMGKALIQGAKNMS